MFFRKSRQIPSEITDSELGHITIRTNVRARNIIMRMRPDGLYMTIPPYVNRQEIDQTLERFRERLLISKEKIGNGTLVDLHFEIRTNLLHIHLEQGVKPQFLAHTKLITYNEDGGFQSGESVIICPPDTDFANPERQEWLKKALAESLRKQAKAYLPIRLQQLSILHNLPFGKVQINSSRTRWGSCSVRRDINLSLYLMTVPTHLIDYVLLHELSHTREMNHSDRFWAFLNSLTDNKAHSLRNELRQYRTSL